MFENDNRIREEIVGSLPSPLAEDELLMLVANGRAYIARADADRFFDYVRAYGLDGDGRCASLVSDGTDAARQLDCALKGVHGHRIDADYLDLGAYDLAEYAECRRWAPVVTVYPVTIELEEDVMDVMFCEQDTNGLGIDWGVFFSGMSAEEAIDAIAKNRTTRHPGGENFRILEVGSPEPVETTWLDQGRFCDFDARPAIDRIVYGMQPMYLPAAEAIVAPRRRLDLDPLALRVDVYTGIDARRLRHIAATEANGDHERTRELLGEPGPHSFTASAHEDGAVPTDAKRRAAELVEGMDFAGARGLDGISPADLERLAIREAEHRDRPQATRHRKR